MKTAQEQRYPTKPPSSPVQKVARVFAGAPLDKMFLTNREVLKIGKADFQARQFVAALDAVGLLPKC